MVVTKIESTDIDLKILGDRDYVSLAPVDMKIRFKHDPTLHLVVDTEFFSDGRSGGPLVDLLLPNVGHQLYRRCWFPHDAFFCLAAECLVKHQEPPISFETANDIFAQIIDLPKAQGGPGFSAIRAWAAHRGVDSWIGEKAYNTVDRIDRRNFGKVHVEWVK